MLLRVTLLLLLAASFGCGTDREAIRGDAQASYKLGLAFLAENRPTRALRELTKGAQLTPDDPEMFNALGEAYWRKREFSEAEASFRRAVELKADFSEAWNNLGALYLSQGRYDAAVEVLQHAVDNVFYQTPERALVNLGWALYKSGRPQQAEVRYREALDIAGGFPLAHKNLAVLLQERGEFSEALEHLDQVLRILPGDADTQLRRGTCLLKLGRREEAKNAFEEAWKLSPGTDLGRSAKTYLELLQ